MRVLAGGVRDRARPRSRGRLVAVQGADALPALAILAVAALTGCPSSKKPAGPAAGDSVTIPLAPRTVGIKWTKLDEGTTSIEVTQGGQTATFGGKRHHRTDSEILAVDGAGLVTKVAVTYVERDDTDGDEVKPSAIAGKSYIAWIEGGEIGATHADGSAVSSEELDELTHDQDELGKPPVMEQIMARTWTRGVKVDLTEAELARAGEDAGDGPKPSAMSFTLRAVEGGVAAFDVIMQMKSVSPPIGIDASGTATIDVRTGRPVRLELAGPVSGSASGMTIGGSMSATVTYTFADPQ